MQLGHILPHYNATLVFWQQRHNSSISIALCSANLLQMLYEVADMGLLHVAVRLLMNYDVLVTYLVLMLQKTFNTSVPPDGRMQDATSLLVFATWV